MVSVPRTCCVHVFYACDFVSEEGREALYLLRSHRAEKGSAGIETVVGLTLMLTFTSFHHIFSEKPSRGDYEVRVSIQGAVQKVDIFKTC